MNDLLFTHLPTRYLLPCQATMQLTFLAIDHEFNWEWRTYRKFLRGQAVIDI
jgi:hypothetical protein